MHSLVIQLDRLTQALQLDDIDVPSPFTLESSQRIAAPTISPRRPATKSLAFDDGVASNHQPSQQSSVASIEAFSDGGGPAVESDLSSETEYKLVRESTKAVPPQQNANTNTGRYRSSLVSPRTTKITRNTASKQIANIPTDDDVELAGSEDNCAARRVLRRRPSPSGFDATDLERAIKLSLQEASITASASSAESSVRRSQRGRNLDESKKVEGLSYAVDTLRDSAVHNKKGSGQSEKFKSKSKPNSSSPVKTTSRRRAATSPAAVVRMIKRGRGKNATNEVLNEDDKNDTDKDTMDETNLIAPMTSLSAVTGALNEPLLAPNTTRCKEGECEKKVVCQSTQPPLKLRREPSSDDDDDDIMNTVYMASTPTLASAPSLIPKIATLTPEDCTYDAYLQDAADAALIMQERGQHQSLPLKSPVSVEPRKPDSSVSGNNDSAKATCFSADPQISTDCSTNVEFSQNKRGPVFPSVTEVTIPNKTPAEDVGSPRIAVDLKFDEVMEAKTDKKDLAHFPHLEDHGNSSVDTAQISESDSEDCRVATVINRGNGSQSSIKQDGDTNKDDLPDTRDREFVAESCLQAGGDETQVYNNEVTAIKSMERNDVDSETPDLQETENYIHQPQSVNIAQVTAANDIGSIEHCVDNDSEEAVTLTTPGRQTAVIRTPTSARSISDGEALSTATTPFNALCTPTQRPSGQRTPMSVRGTSESIPSIESYEDTQQINEEAAAVAARMAIVEAAIAAGTVGCGGTDMANVSSVVEAEEENSDMAPIAHSTKLPIKLCFSGIQLSLWAPRLKPIVEAAAGSIFETYDSAITHVIASVNSERLAKKRTLKLIRGIADGAWILTLEWVEACINAGELVPEDKYEVLGLVRDGEPDVFGGPRCSRCARNEVDAVPLFDGWSFYIFPPSCGKSGVPETDLMLMLKSVGATVLQSLPEGHDPRLVVIADEPEVDEAPDADPKYCAAFDDMADATEAQIARTTYVFDSITAYEVKDIGPYLIAFDDSDYEAERTDADADGLGSGGTLSQQIL